MPKCDFQNCFATVLKSHFGMGVLLYICCIFSEHLFIKITIKGCFCIGGKGIKRESKGNQKGSLRRNEFIPPKKS